MSLTQRLAPLEQRLALKSPPPRIMPFGEWLPDQPALGNPGCVEAKNVIPHMQSYCALPSLSVNSAALTDYARGGFSLKKASDGNTFFYAGDETNLYEIRNQSLTDKSSTTYATTAKNYWEFTQFGDQLIATNLDDSLQVITAGAGGNFADLISVGDNPKFRTIATVRDFVVGGYEDDGTIRPSNVRWSALADITDWDESAQTQADRQTLPIGGEVTKVVGGVEYGVVFSETAIHRMTYVGSPLIFDFDAADRARGCPFPRTIVALGRNIFFWTEEGYFVFDGSTSTPLGANKVDRWFLDQIDPAQAHRMSAAIDRPNHLIVTSFPGAGSSSGNPNLLLFYDYVNNRFSYAEQDAELVVSAATQAFTLEDLDTPYSSTIDGALQTSFDSDDWKGGIYKFAAFNTDHKQAFFTGASRAAEFVTGETQLTPGFKTRIEDVRPIVDMDSATVTIGVAGRDNQTDTVSFDTSTSVSTEGLSSQRNKKRYHRFKLNVAAGATDGHMIGVEVTHRPAGRR